MKKIMRWAIITFSLPLALSLRNVPFLALDKSQMSEYEEKFRQIEDTSLSELEAINKNKTGYSIQAFR